MNDSNSSTTPAAANQRDGIGRLFVVSAPSGAGKTSITGRLKEDGVVRVSVSHTTRAPREQEKNGEAYFFVSVEEFLAMRDAGDFIEWAEVYGNYYGTSKNWVSRQLSDGQNVLLEIDCQGAMQIRKLYPQTVMIFICPPDLDTLRQRLLARQQDDSDTLELRLAAAEKEIAYKKHFDYVIINDDLETAVQKTAAAILQHKYL